MNEMNILTLNGEQYEIADQKARKHNKNTAPAIPVTMTGTAVSTDMVSNAEHEVKCDVLRVNLLDTKWQEKTVSQQDVTWTVASNGIITGTPVGQSTTTDSVLEVFNPRENPLITPLKAGTYKFASVDNPSDSTRTTFLLYDEDKNKLLERMEIVDNGIFTISKDAYYVRLRVILKSGISGVTTFIPQFTLGKEKHPVAPYVPDLTKVTVTQNPGGKTFKPSSDGTVTGMKSISPGMTITTDNPGVTIEATYNADTKKYIDHKFTELQSAILSTGGNV